jgi:menaquinol-cytochrome c reductase iron-sulfur subunit
MTRREFYRLAARALGFLIGLVLVVPGAAYLLSPLRRRRQDAGFAPIARLSQLPVGVPRSYPIVQDRRDAWVRYPREPVGSVWLVRQRDGAQPAIRAFTSECPHLGCPINVASDGTSFQCPCHTSSFDLEGNPLNHVPPRPMDQLEVELSEETDPEVRVKFQRFRAQTEEKIALA